MSDRAGDSAAPANVGDALWPKRQFVARSTLTAHQQRAEYLAGRHKLPACSQAKLEYDLWPLRERYGKLPAQRIAKLTCTCR